MCIRASPFVLVIGGLDGPVKVAKLNLAVGLENGFQLSNH